MLVVFYALSTTMVADLTFTEFKIAGGNFNAKEITSFVDLNKHPLLIVLNSKNANTVYSSPQKLHVRLLALLLVHPLVIFTWHLVKNESLHCFSCYEVVQIC